MELLSSLNEKQREAASHDEGPILVIAGAGTGKTRVLTHRIAYLIESGRAMPGEILSITFTNKAAKEMKDRVGTLVNYDVDRMWIGTFHSICVRILRKYIERLGYERNFVIYDTDDQKSLIKICIKELNLDVKKYPINFIKELIGKQKNLRVSPEKYMQENYSNFMTRNYGYIYELYEKKLKISNALDFDDLLIKALLLLEKEEDIRDYYQNRFKYILVDEYQDTNNIQYKLIKILGCKADGNNNVFVVGDDDQSIYGWRGADINNILDFEKDFPGSKLVKLEKNYRSTNVILGVANAVIANNFNRKGKNLYTDEVGGEVVTLIKAYDEKEEAFKVASYIKKENSDNNIAYSNIAILYRANAQSRAVEEGLMALGIPYKIVGGLKFYGRKEIKDIMAYLMLTENPRDDISFSRIINVPKRKIGEKALNSLQKYAVEHEVSLFDACYEASKLDITSAGIASIGKFVKTMELLMIKKDVMPLSEFVKAVYEDTGYEAMLAEDQSAEGLSRIENVQEFLSAVKDFEERYEEKTLEGFLAHISLLADTDKTENTESDKVTLLTVHSAKGLEYDVVFIVGLEEKMFPIIRDDTENGDLEEERRLFYVAVTRARKRLYLSNTTERLVYGHHEYRKPSRFIKEIPEKFLAKPFVNEKHSDDNFQNKHGKKSSGEFDEYFGDETNYVPSFKAKSKKNTYFTGMGSYNNDYEDGMVVVDVYADIKNENSSEFAVGDKVSHKSWGEGCIISILEDDKGNKAQISFEKMGVKTVVLGKAPIVKLY